MAQIQQSCAARQAGRRLFILCACIFSIVLYSQAQTVKYLPPLVAAFIRPAQGHPTMEIEDPEIRAAVRRFTFALIGEGAEA